MPHHEWEYPVDCSQIKLIFICNYMYSNLEKKEVKCHKIYIILFIFWGKTLHMHVTLQWVTNFKRRQATMEPRHWATQ